MKGFFCVQKGIVKIYKTGIDGKEQIIRFAQPCYIIGYRSVVSNEPACTTTEVLGEANTYITDIAQKTVKGRLAEILIHLDDDFGVDHEKNLNISLTREELSNIVGTATESIISLLSEFNNKGLIDLCGRKIKILDKPGLKFIAGL